MQIEELRRRVHNELHWCLSGSGYSGKTHIAKEKGNTSSLCGVAVDTRYCRTAWSNICKRCVSLAEAHLTQLALDGAVCPAHQTYFEEDGTCAIAGCKETRPAGKT